MLEQAAESDLQSYGWRRSALRDAIGQVSTEAQITQLLDAGGTLMRSLLATQLDYRRPLNIDPQHQEPQHGAAAPDAQSKGTTCPVST
jgi:hypothetical protein